MSPLSEGGPNFAAPLREYLEAYCLRRGEKCLTLPPSRQEHITLQLSSEERRLYDLILNNTRRQINSLVSKRDIRSCSKFFTAMLRMRMLCNLGTYSSNGSRTISVGRHDLEIGCELCSATDDDATTLLDGYSVCPQCGRPLQQSSPLPEFIDDPRSDADNSGRNAGMALDKAAYALVAQMNPFLRGGISTKLNAVVQNVVCCGPDAKR